VFGLPVFLIKPLLYVGAAIVAAWFAHHLWSNFKDSIGADYTQAQIKKDQPLINTANANAKAADEERDHAKADTESCRAGAKTQSDAIDKERLRADKAQKEAHAIIAADKRDSAARDAEFRRLAAIAAAKPQTDQSCADALSKADATLRPLMRQRQGAK